MALNKTDIEQSLSAVALEQWLQLSCAHSCQTLVSPGDADDSRVLCKEYAPSAISSNASVQQLAAHIDSLPESLEHFAAFRLVNEQAGHLRLFRQFVVGTPLAQSGTHELDLDGRIRIGISLAISLQELHAAGLTHNNLKPSNVIVDAARRVILVDGAIDLVRTDLDFDEPDPHRQQDTASVDYQSPECLGLIRAGIGPPSDLYSLGIILFELLSGAAPFAGKELSERLHCKATSTPPPIRIPGNPVPRVLEQLVLRLLQIDPGDRYQTCEAVIADLRKIEAEWTAGNHNPVLPLGTHDIRQTLVEPNLVGRRSELQQLAAEMYAARKGQSGVVVVEAASGGGKSQLLAELSAMARQSGFRVFAAMCSQQQVGRESSCLFDLDRQLAAACASDALLASLIQKKMQHDKDSLAIAFPTMCEVFGWKPGESGPEAFGQARVTGAVCRLLELLGEGNRACLILLDDCQWIDESAEKLLTAWKKRVVNRKDQPLNVVFAVAFRSDEVSTLSSLRQLDPTTWLRLEQMADHDIRGIALSMAGRLPDHVLHIVTRMAGGSPFMATALVRGMFETGAIRPSPAGWTVDRDELSELQSSTDAGRVLARRIDLLPQALIRFLTAGAILGKSFHLDVARRLIQAPDKCWRQAESKNLIWVDLQTGKCHFVHDQIRAALLKQLNEQQTRQLHFAAACLFADSAEPESLAVRPGSGDPGTKGLCPGCGPATIRNRQAGPTGR